jgi:hypothetical protein
MLPVAVESAVAGASVVVAVVSADLSELQLLSSRVPEQRAARRNADFFMGVGEELKVKNEVFGLRIRPSR